MTTLLEVLPPALGADVQRGVEAGWLTVPDVPWCPNGHQRTPENTYRWRGRSYCRECRRSYMRGYEHGLRRPKVAPTQCPQGHEYTGANTVWKGGRRRCRMCRRQQERDRRSRR